MPLVIGKILTVIGARPQFIKSAPVSRALEGDFQEILVHTGQHYDKNMSNVFFNELEIKKPEYNLGIKSSNFGEQVGTILTEVEKIQVINYLKASRFEVGLLINFGSKSLDFKRLINSNQCNLRLVKKGIKCQRRMYIIGIILILMR